MKKDFKASKFIGKSAAQRILQASLLAQIVASVKCGPLVSQDATDAAGVAARSTATSSPHARGVASNESGLVTAMSVTTSTPVLSRVTDSNESSPFSLAACMLSSADDAWHRAVEEQLQSGNEELRAGSAQLLREQMHPKTTSESVYVQCDHGWVLAAGRLDRSILERCQRVPCVASVRAWWKKFRVHALAAINSRPSVATGSSPLRPAANSSPTPLAPALSVAPSDTSSSPTSTVSQSTHPSSTAPSALPSGDAAPVEQFPAASQVVPPSPSCQLSL